MYTIEDDARSYLSRQLGGIDMSQAPIEGVKACVDKSYDGGWEAFEADFHRVMDTVAAPEPVLTAFQKWAKLPDIIGGSRHNFMLRTHQEVDSVDIGEDEIKAVLTIAKVDERSQRDRVTYGKKLIVWKRTDSGWERAEIEAWGEEVHELVRWGRVRTPDYVASQREQFETCYRPGTKKSPLQGPAARLGVSREEFHNLSKGQ